MAHSYITAAELLNINDRNLADFEASAVLNKAPLVAAMAANPASHGTQHKFLRLTTDPTVGFRAANDGRENSKSVDTLVTVSLGILDASFAVDRALANSHPAGADALIQREGLRHLQAALFELEKQIIYGTGNDASGPAGLADDTDLDALADSQVINAGGATAGGCTSVYLLRTAEDGAAVVLGNDGRFEMGETVVTRIEGASGAFAAYWTPLEGWAGLQIGSKYDVARICNIDSSNPLTDDLLADAIEQFPGAGDPNIIVMNRTAQGQLRDSRTATNPTGAPAPFPDEAFGIPVVVSNAITSTENPVT